MQLSYGTKKENKIILNELIDEAFANHIITSEQIEGPVKMWYCGRKGTGIYSYRVISAPGMLLVYGDVGDYMLQANDRDLVPWLRGAVKSENYLISKFVNKGEIFFPDEAVQLLNDLVLEADEYDKTEGYDEDEDGNKIDGHYGPPARKLRRDVLDEWDAEYDDGPSFAKTFYGAGGDVELIDRTIDYSSSVYWTAGCLKKFIKLLDESQKVADSITCS